MSYNHLTLNEINKIEVVKRELFFYKNSENFKMSSFYNSYIAY